MRSRLAAGITSAMLAFCAQAAEPLENLAQLQWSNRVIVVDASRQPAGTPLVSAEAEIDDRHILWFVLNGDAIKTNYKGELTGKFAHHLRRTLQLAPGEAVLIGKDGGIKSRRGELDTAALFAQIDTMPMRQREMREQEAASD